MKIKTLIPLSFLSVSLLFSCGKKSKTLSSIETSGEVKTIYKLNETFVKPTIMANYSDDSKIDVTNNCTWSEFDSSKIGVDFKYTITYSENDITKSLDIAYTVIEEKEINFNLDCADSSLILDTKSDIKCGQDFKAIIKVNDSKEFIEKDDPTHTKKKFSDYFILPDNVVLYSGENKEIVDKKYYSFVNGELNVKGEGIVDNLYLEASGIQYKFDYGASVNYTDAIKLGSTFVELGKDYSTNITINNDFEGYVELPNKEDLDEKLFLYSGDTGERISKENYTYEKINEHTANLLLKGSLVKGKIYIDLESIVSFNIDIYDENQVIKVDKTIAQASYEDLELNLLIDPDKKAEGYDLPSTFTGGSVIIDGVIIPEKTNDETPGFTYNYSTKKIIIDAECVKKNTQKFNNQNLDIKINLNSVKGNIKILFKTSTTDSKVKYTDINGNELISPLDIEKDKAFSFYIETIDHKINSSSGYYITEDDIKIFVDGKEKKLDEDFTFSYPDELDPTRAQIDIAEDVLNKNSEVYCEAKNYKYVNVEKYSSLLDFEGNNYSLIGEPYIVKITAKTGHENPKSDDLVIRVGDTMSRSEWKFYYVGDQGVAYDEKTCTLTIDPSVYGNKSFLISGKPHDVTNLLAYCSFSEIKEYGQFGFADKLFKIGELTRQFNVNDELYQARLIGFKQDQGKNYIDNAMTFEFTNCLSTTSFFRYQTSKDNKYNGSLLMENLENAFNNTEDDLKNSIALTTKKSLEYTFGNYELKNISNLHYFAFSLGEIGTDKNTKYNDEKYTSSVYEFYSNKSSDEQRKLRIKTNGKGKIVTYWLRSPDLDQSHDSLYVKTVYGMSGAYEPNQGTFNHQGVQSSQYILPGFCI